jgi:hypothetical protein
MSQSVRLLAGGNTDTRSVEQGRYLEVVGGEKR